MHESQTDPPPADDGLNTAQARVEMAHACFLAILADPANAKAIAKAGIDLCTLTEAQRAEMRGEEYDLAPAALPAEQEGCDDAG